MINLSEKNSCFIWMPPRTASHTAVTIFKNFDFKCYSLENNQLKIEKNYFEHNHDTVFFPQHMRYNFLLTMRNPYVLYVSLSIKEGNKSKDEIIDGIESKFQDGNPMYDLQHNLLKRKPNYVIRVENIFEDYFKIPFVKNSELYKSGFINQILKEKLDVSDTNYDWREFYNQRLADMVYYSSSVLFNLFGYDKDSWKI